MRKFLGRSDSGTFILVLDDRLIMTARIIAVRVLDTECKSCRIRYREAHMLEVDGKREFYCTICANRLLGRSPGDSPLPVSSSDW